MHDMVLFYGDSCKKKILHNFFKVLERLLVTISILVNRALICKFSSLICDSSSLVILSSLLTFLNSPVLKKRLFFG